MKHFILGILLLLSTQVWALPAPKQIQDAVHAGQFVQAEQMLREVIVAKPDSALAYYELGQVLAREQRHREAVQALQQAQTLEPSLKFARSADLFHQMLAAEQTSAQQQSHTTVRSASSSTSIAHTKPLAITQNQQSGPAHSLPAGLLVVIALCLVAVFVFVKRKNSREQNDRARRLEQMADQQLSDLLRQAEQVRDAELECRAATYAPEKKEFVLEAVRRHNDAIMQAITQCRDGAPIGSGTMSALTSETHRVCAAAKLGEFPPMPAQNLAGQSYSAGPGYAAGQPQSGYGAPQEPPYQNNGGYSGSQHSTGSGIGGALGGLAAGVVIGEMLGHHGSAGASERIVEVVEERAPESAERGSDNWFDFDGSDSNADADWNNDDDSSRDSNNWGGDSDWGSSDNSDSSSFDSGDSSSDDSSW